MARFIILGDVIAMSVRFNPAACCKSVRAYADAKKHDSEIMKMSAQTAVQKYFLALAGMQLSGFQPVDLLCPAKIIKQSTNYSDN